MILKLKQTPGIYLAGFMGSGKNAIGELLADEIGWPFVCLDAQIEKQEGVSISQIFRDRGEPAFREIETQVLRKLIHNVECGRPAVIALGGGAFTLEVNRKMLEQNGITVWLDCPFDIIQKRIGEHNHRPLAADPEHLRKLYDERRPLYAQAECRVDSSNEDPMVTLRELLGLECFK